MLRPPPPSGGTQSLVDLFFGGEWDFLDADDFSLVGADDDNLRVEAPVKRIGDGVRRGGRRLGERARPSRHVEGQAADPMRITNDLEAGTEFAGVALDRDAEKSGRPPRRSIRMSPRRYRKALVHRMA